MSHTLLCNPLNNADSFLKQDNAIFLRLKLLNE